MRSIATFIVAGLLISGCIMEPKKDKPQETTPIAILDSDKDGVTDDKDKCPNQAGTVANEGCPPEKKEEKKPHQMERGDRVKLPGIDTIAVH